MATFNNTFIFDAPAIGSPAASWGSNIFVMHDDVELNDDNWNEPHLLASSYDSSSALTNTNSIEVIVPSAGLSLEMYLVTDDITDEEVQLGVFGKVPTKEGITGTDRRWPGDVNSAAFDNPTDIWVPLQNLEAVYTSAVSPAIGAARTNQTSRITMSYDGDTQGPALKFDSTNEWYMSQRVSVYLAGCTSVIVGVAAGSGISEGLVLGRFVG